MPMWRCPHCETPQAETARCWVCHRSSTACASCRNFRRSVAAQVGFCGLDRERRPLRGDEIRACWEGRAVVPESPATGIPRSAPTAATFIDDRTPVRRLEFVEVGTNAERPVRPVQKRTEGSVAVADSDDERVVEPESGQAGLPEIRWSLWGDVEA